MLAFPWPMNWWALATGQTLPIVQNQTLSALYGTFFGGDGRTTFGLPDLQGRGVVGQGQGNGRPFAALGRAHGCGDLSPDAVVDATARAHGDFGRDGRGARLRGRSWNGGSGTDGGYRWRHRRRDAAAESRGESAGMPERALR